MKSFTRNLGQHLTFRPCFGQRKINIRKLEGNKDQYSVTDGDELTATLNGKIEVLYYLKGVCNYHYVR